MQTERVKNWQPMGEPLHQDFRTCATEAPPREVSFGTSRAGEAHCASFQACMEARGYRLRSESVWEKFGDALLLPYFLALKVAGTCLN